MGPGQTIHYLVDWMMAYAKSLCQFTARVVACCSQCSNISDLPLSQFSVTGSLSSCSDAWIITDAVKDAALTVNHVAHVVRVRPKIEMVWADAWWIIAAVQYTQAVDWTVCISVDKSVCAHGRPFTPADAKRAVRTLAGYLSSSNPNPAFTGLINVRPKSSNQVIVKQSRHDAKATQLLEFA